MAAQQIPKMEILGVHCNFTTIQKTFKLFLVSTILRGEKNCNFGVFILQKSLVMSDVYSDVRCL